MQGRKKLTLEERAKREAKRVRRAERATRSSPAAQSEIQQEDRKRRHHYVWRHYLEAWGDPGGRVWCQRGGSRFLAMTTNIGLRKDFYQLKEMSDRDLHYVEQLVIERMPDARARESARGWIPMFRGVFQIRDSARRRGVSSAELDVLLETRISNLEEELHADVESRAIAPLDALRRGDVSLLQRKETYIDLAQFLGMQYMRTPSMAASMLEAFAGLPDFNVSAAWGLMRTIFAMNIGGQIFVRRALTNLCFLEAGPSSQFITGDQPLVNLGGTERMDLYYPLAPTRALMLALDHGQPGVELRTLTDAETRAHNNRIRAAAEEQLYAASEASLIELDQSAVPP